MSIQRYILFFESQIFLETFIHKTGYSCGHIFGIHARQPFPVAHARVAGPEQERAALSAVADSGKPLPLQPFGSACPSTRSGCAVPCGPSRSQARVPSLPGPANPALSAPGKPLIACCPARISRRAFKTVSVSVTTYWHEVSMQLQGRLPKNWELL